MMATAADATDPPRPNIVFLLADDVGWGDLACFNTRGRIPTPHLDALARTGMMFTDAHTPAALCAPSRYALMTGNYPWRGRRPGGTWRWEAPPQFLPGQATSGHLLRDAGYRTALFGKVHCGSGFAQDSAGRPDFGRRLPEGPSHWGFCVSYILLNGHQGPPYCFFENDRVAGDPANIVQLPAGPINGGVVPVAGPGFTTWDSSRVSERLLDKTLAFIDAEDDRPFFVHLSADAVHTPWTPPETLAGTPVRGVTRMTARTDMVFAFDVLVGKLVAALEHRGLLADTLIVVTSDNGGVPVERANHDHDAVGGLRGSKSCISEGGHRVPFIASWQGRITPGQVRGQLICAHDVVPTFVELAGAACDPDQMLDAVSLVPVLLGRQGDEQPVRQSLVIQSQRGRDAFDEVRDDFPEIAARVRRVGSHGMSHALRSGPWKLVFDIEHDAAVALYNLDEDLGEATNLIADPRQLQRVASLDRLYRDIRSSRRSTPHPEPADGANVLP